MHRNHRTVCPESVDGFHRNRWTEWIGISGRLRPEYAVFAHSGAISVAPPVTGLTIDGDLSDWPATIPVSAISHAEYGDQPTDDDDLSAWLQAAYNAEQGLLYIGVRVRDQSFVVDRSNPNNWQRLHRTKH